jgi:hypothetical protein
VLFRSFIPNITASAAASRQAEGLPLVFAWALPLMAITALLMIASYRTMTAGKRKENDALPI